MASRLGLDAAPARIEARRYFENHYIDRLHIFLYPRLRERGLAESLIRFENLEVLDRVRAAGRGVLIVQPHFGPVQLTLLGLAHKGYDPVQIGYLSDKGLSRIGRAVAFRYRMRYESLLPAIVQADGFLGSAYKRLRAGGVVLTTGDGAGGGVYLGEHRPLPFLGAERLFPLGPATWAIRTGAAFIPTFIVPVRHDLFRIVLEEPIEPRGGEDDALVMTERFAALAERYIREYPAAWHFWDEL
jgi:lauroyl/myristoyl acyltransferase